MVRELACCEVIFRALFNIVIGWRWHRGSDAPGKPGKGYYVCVDVRDALSAAPVCHDEACLGPHASRKTSGFVRSRTRLC